MAISQRIRSLPVCKEDNTGGGKNAMQAGDGIEALRIIANIPDAGGFPLAAKWLFVVVDANQRGGNLSGLLTPKEAAARLKLKTTDTLARWVKNGLIKAIRTPTGRYRYSEAEVERIKNGDCMSSAVCHRSSNFHLTLGVFEPCQDESGHRPSRAHFPPQGRSQEILAKDPVHVRSFLGEDARGASGQPGHEFWVLPPATGGNRA